MYFLILTVFSSALLIGCAMQTKSSQDIENEKAQVAATLLKFWKAYERKDLPTMVGMLTASSSDFVFFGSDAAEVIKSRQEWGTLMQNDWQLFESTNFEEPRNLAIQVSGDGKMASAMYEVHDISVVGGKLVKSLDRFAITLRKENGYWHIVQGMTAVATFGESSAEIVIRRKTTAPRH